MSTYFLSGTGFVYDDKFIRGQSSSNSIDQSQINIYSKSNLIGIGISNPTFPLDVNGRIRSQGVNAGIVINSSIYTDTTLNTTIIEAYNANIKSIFSSNTAVYASNNLTNAGNFLPITGGTLTGGLKATNIGLQGYNVDTNFGLSASNILLTKRYDALTFANNCYLGSSPTGDMIFNIDINKNWQVYNTGGIVLLDLSSANKKLYLYGDVTTPSNITAKSININDDITANRMSIGNITSFGNVIIDNNIRVGSANVIGNITSQSANVTNNITMGTGIVNGRITANSGNISGFFTIINN
jgi:hypothetical protein